MTSTLLTDAGELVTGDSDAGEGPLGILRDAALVIDDGRIAWVGASAHAPAADGMVDLCGAAVLPGWVDSHAHLVFAGDRSAEFAARMAGSPTQQAASAPPWRRPAQRATKPCGTT